MISMFYIVPFFKGIDWVNKPIFNWLVNAVNIAVFMVIEYLHVIFKLGAWDNNDSIAACIGITAAIVVYFRKKSVGTFK